MFWGCVFLVCLLGSLPLAASPKRLDQLSDGNYIFAAQLPKTDRHPQIQLAGIEIYAFAKKGKAVVGEIFIANSSEASCFQGNIHQSAIEGRVVISEPKDSKQTIQFKTDLALFHPISPPLLPYAQSSVNRCQQIFQSR